jgi:hypothetical protein
MLSSSPSTDGIRQVGRKLVNRGKRSPIRSAASSTGRFDNHRCVPQDEYAAAAVR